MTASPEIDSSETQFIGLAPFLRLSIAGADFSPLGQQMLEQAGNNPRDANLWMNLATLMFCLGQRPLAFSAQAQALAQQRVYRFAASQQPAKVRLLLLVAPGDLSANAPVDCLLEESDVDLYFYFVSPDEPFAAPVPEHDVVMVAITEGEAHRELLLALEDALAAWPKPVINRPQHIPSVGRDAASALLRDVPGLFIPATHEASRAQLAAIAAGELTVAGLFAGCDFPIILRPIGSQGGHGLDRLFTPAEVAAYLAKIAGESFFISRFIDYSGKDGLFRKYRVGLIDGKPYACHMAVSSHWMVHYVNAGMYEEAQKRAEELAFMEKFDQFVQRHGAALTAIHQLTQLDYLFIDCAELPDGRLFIFEIDHAMVVHAMDPEEMFPYKQMHMRKVSDGLRDFLRRLQSGTLPSRVE